MTASANQRMRIRKAAMREVVVTVFGEDAVANKNKPFRPTTTFDGLIEERIREAVLEESFQVASAQIGQQLTTAGDEHNGWAGLCRKYLKEEPELAVPEPSSLILPSRPTSVEEEKRRAEAVAEMRKQGVEFPA